LPLLLLPVIPPPPLPTFLFLFFFFFFFPPLLLLPPLLLWPPTIFETLFVLLLFVRTETTVEEVTANLAQPSAKSGKKSQSRSRLSTGRHQQRQKRHSRALLQAGRF
jgi:hypothetical protein